MTFLGTVITCTVITAIVTILVKAIWDWATNKNGKEEWSEIKTEIEKQRKEFAELKILILLEYVKKDDFEKLSERIFNIRDMSITNKNNIDMIKESAKQNLERMSVIENRIFKME